MKHVGWVVLAVVGVLALWSWHSTQAQQDTAQIARGQYLVDTVGACGSCHTPRKGAEVDPDRYLSGHPADAPAPSFSMGLIQQGVLISVNQTYTAFSGPWGTSFASNLTPDDTGIGNWSETQFVAALKSGQHLGAGSARAILPPMPWKFYKDMTDEDLQAIWAYLQTVEPIENRVPEALNPVREAVLGKTGEIQYPGIHLSFAD